MGLASASGGLLAVSPLGFLIAAAILIFLTLVIHHGARANFVTGLVIAPIFWIFGLRGIEFWMAVPIGILLACRSAVDWNRKYRELWLDRERT